MLIQATKDTYLYHLFFEVEFKGFESAQHFLCLPAFIFLIEKNIKQIFPSLIASLK